MRFIHTADWQIGARFRQFGERAAWLRSVRLRTLHRALEEAERVRVDGFLIAGDLFEDHGVDSAATAQVFELLAGFPWLPIFILPGNHDPASGPGSIWARPPFKSPPSHVTIFQSPSAVPLGDGFLLANPLTSKRSTLDPSLRLDELARTLPIESGPRVGLTHGSLKIESRHQADDFPIPLDAATRAGLDYLALGHWHGALKLEGGRVVMAGTPEATDFAQSGGGWIHEVGIAARGARPEIRSLEIGELKWREEIIEAGPTGESPPPFSPALQEALATPERLVARVILRGRATPEAAEQARLEIERRLAGCAALEIRSEIAPEASAADLAELSQRHPLLAGVLGDLDSMARSAGDSLSAPPNSQPTLSAALVSEICAQAGCTPADLTPELVALCRQILLQQLQEACPPC